MDTIFMQAFITLSLISILLSPFVGSILIDKELSPKNNKWEKILVVHFIKLAIFFSSLSLIALFDKGEKIYESGGDLMFGGSSSYKYEELNLFIGFCIFLISFLTFIHLKKRIYSIKESFNFVCFTELLFFIGFLLISLVFSLF